MKIAIFGWYGHNNAGDERIKYCLTHFLSCIGGIEKIDFYDLHKNARNGKTNKFDDYDLVIIGGGGLILSQCNYHDFINGLNTKLVTLGISVERPLTGNSKKFAISLINKSSAFLVRDQKSSEKLSPYDPNKKIKVSSDLTFLQPYESVNIQNFKGISKIGINLLPKPAHIKYSTLNSSFFSFFLRNLDRLRLPSPIKIIDFKNIIDELQCRFKVLPIPLYCDPQEKELPLYQKNDVEFLKDYFQKVPEIFSDTSIDECSLFLSMRLHGSIFAIQKGIPALSLSYLPKNKNFMDAVGLSDLVLESFQIKEILNVIDYIQKNKSSIQEKMLSYREKATLKIRQDLTETLNLIR